jgi:hypothetical protein
MKKLLLLLFAFTSAALADTPIISTTAPVNGTTDAAAGQTVLVSDNSAAPFSVYLCTTRTGGVGTTVFQKVYDRGDGLNPAIVVDRFKLSTDGADDAAMIRRAFDAAIASSIPRVVFSPRRYLATSNVTADTGAANQVGAAIQVKGSGEVPLLIVEGNGAEIYKNGSDMGDLFYIRKTIRSLEINNLRLTHDHPSGLTSQWPGGLTIDAPFDDPAMTRLQITGCKFTGCNRSINIGQSRNWLTSFGKITSVSIKDCDFLHPYGGNYGPGNTGSQSVYLSEWGTNILVEGCNFDGAVNTLPLNCYPVDGFIFGVGINTVVRDCTLKHFDVEGIYFIGDEGRAGGNGASFTVPAVGSNFTFPFVNNPNQDTTGWQVGERFKISEPTNDAPVFTHEFEVVSIDSSTAMTVKVISGPPGLISGAGTRWIYNMRLYNIEQTAKALNVTCRDTYPVGVGGPGLNGASPAIEFRFINHAEVRDCVIADSVVGLSCGGGDRLKSVTYAGNMVKSRDWCMGVYPNYGYSANILIENNDLEIANSSTTGAFAIACHPSGAVIRNNRMRFSGTGTGTVAIQANNAGKGLKIYENLIENFAYDFGGPAADQVFRDNTLNSVGTTNGVPLREFTEFNNGVKTNEIEIQKNGTTYYVPAFTR